MTTSTEPTEGHHYPYPPQDTPPTGHAEYPRGYFQPTTPVSLKNPGLALLASFFLPGLGQMVNGEQRKGVMFMVGTLVAAVWVVLLVGLLILPVVWVFSMVDAYRSAKDWNIRHGLERWVE